MKNFESDNKSAQVILHFKSSDGIFTVGKPIHVDGLLYYPTKTDQKIFSLYFPNTLTPDEYDLLSNDKIWQTFDRGSLLIIPSGIIHEHQYNFSGTPLLTNFDTVWTQGGFQDGYIIIHDPSNITNLEKISLEKVISIEPTDALQNTKTNNMILGLTLCVVAFSLITIFLNDKKFRK